MKKRLISIALSALFTLNGAVCFASGSFTDLNEFHAWAEPQIEEMTTLGIIKGYTDGSFRPDQAITKTEALVLISRAAGYITQDYDTFKKASSEKYSKAVEQFSTPYPNEVSYLLYKGILQENELDSYISEGRATSPLLRYEMAELLTKLMREDKNIDPDKVASLSYKDSGEIPHNATAYVKYVTKASLMQGVYDPEYPDDVFFKPFSSVTRAQMAVLLHRVLDKSPVRVEYYQVVGKNPATGNITYRDTEGKTLIHRLTDDVNLIIDGTHTRDVSYIGTGAKMALFYINERLADIEIVNTTPNKWDGVEKVEEVIPTTPVEGTISRIVMDEDCSVTIDGVEYTLSAASSIYVNHVASTIYDLRVGHTAELKFENGKAILLYAINSADVSLNARVADGIITEINLTNRSLYLNVTNSQTGITSRKQLFLETGAVVVNALSGKTLDFVSLEIDDHISATGTFKDGDFYASKIIVR